jgi:hypothetical protein
MPPNPDIWRFASACWGWVASQVVHRPDLALPLQPRGDLAGAGIVAVHADRKRLDAAEHEEKSIGDRIAPTLF